jgi:two-component system sensor histidine kinase YesM
MPLSRLVEAINKIKEGHWDTRMDMTFVSDEFILVNDTFNSLIDEIKSLKIAAYEEKIEKQKAKLQHLLFQIRPHFFLNALKNLYGMAEQQQYEIIQIMILGLSNHFRYMFNDNFNLVTLSEELYHIKNYLEIQELSTAYSTDCKINVDEQLLEMTLPPISIKTFIENSMQHGVQQDKNLKITIKAVLLKTEDGDFADITVSDNGPGFDEVTLTRLNFVNEENAIKGHIGLDNIRQRIRLIYGSRGHVVFSNNTNGGAVSELLIPIVMANDESEDMK